MKTHTNFLRVWGNLRWSGILWQIKWCKIWRKDGFEEAIMAGQCKECRFYDGKICAI